MMFLESDQLTATQLDRWTGEADGGGFEGRVVVVGTDITDDNIGYLLRAMRGAEFDAIFYPQVLHEL